MKHVLTLLLVVTGTLATAPAAISVTATAQSTARPTQSCEGLASLTLLDTTIASAQRVPAGTFNPPRPLPPAGPRGGLPIVGLRDLPEFCRVAGVIRPAKASEIKFEVWMPTANWNGKFVAVGNGGFVGVINYPLMTEPLSRQYATASTDTGHDGSSASFGLGHPEKVIDFAYRAAHETALVSKLIVAAYYGQGPRFSYWNGCSTGGRQGLVEAQRFPADFDGIIAGDPANPMVHGSAGSVSKYVAIETTPAALVPLSKLTMLHEAVLDACDRLDGVKDGVLEDPTRCAFEPAVLECRGEDRPNCLTHAQVELVRAFYAPVRNPRTKEQLRPGYARGGEVQWGDAAGNGHMVASASYGTGDFFKYIVFQDANWDYRTFDLDRSVEAADQSINGRLFNVDPDLRAFSRRGGKLLQYHGWSDPSIPPVSSVDYYNSVGKLLGPDEIRNAYRLFMVPGMAHCWGGDGPTTFDPLGALEKWVEVGTAPDRIVASRWVDGKIDQTHPLCPYPQVAAYKGTGSTDVAENFICKVR